MGGTVPILPSDKRLPRAAAAEYSRGSVPACEEAWRTARSSGGGRSLTLATLIAIRQEAIIRRFVTYVASRPTTPPLSRAQLTGAMPSFLRELVCTLREGYDGRAPAHEEVPAKEHAASRFELGFAMETVVDEYGALLETVLAVAMEEGVPMTESERRALNRARRLGVEATTQYVFKGAADV